MVTAGLRHHNKALLENGTGTGKRVSFSTIGKLREEALNLFLALNLFFVKVRTMYYR
jgi:hypothetical protein